MNKIDWPVLARRVGNLSIVVGYFVLLNVDVTTGVYIRLFANTLILPWAIRSKLWDVVILLSFLMCIEIHKLIVLFLL